MCDLGGRPAYARCYASAGAYCTASDYDRPSTTRLAECYRASCSRADSKCGPGKSKHDAANEYDWAADTHYHQSGRRGDSNYASDANHSRDSTNDTGSGNAGQYAADNPRTGAGSRERALRAPTGNYAADQFHWESAAEHSRDKSWCPGIGTNSSEPYRSSSGEHAAADRAPESDCAVSCRIGQQREYAAIHVMATS